MSQTLATQRQALCGASLSRNATRAPRPFVARSRMVVAAAHQGPNDAFMKTIGAIAAAQMALLPFAGVAAAGPVVGAADPVKVLQQKTRESASAARSVANKSGAPDPIKVLNKAKGAAKNVSANPARDFARKAESANKSAVKGAKKAVAAIKPSVVKQDVKKIAAKVGTPTEEFIKKQAREKGVTKKNGFPLLTIGMPYGDLQHDVLFGFGEKKATKKVEKAAENVTEGAKQADAKAKEAAPSSFSIFDADSVADARKELKQNLNNAVSQQNADPAAQVVPEGARDSKPGETQEENAEKVRREAESGDRAGGGATSGGDARAPTSGA